LSRIDGKRTFRHTVDPGLPFGCALKHNAMDIETSAVLIVMLPGGVNPEAVAIPPAPSPNNRGIDIQALWTARK